eukprot:1193100-Prorocentrum_minimum.AAC.1
MKTPGGLSTDYRPNATRLYSTVRKRGYRIWRVAFKVCPPTYSNAHEPMEARSTRRALVGSFCFVATDSISPQIPPGVARVCRAPGGSGGKNVCRAWTADKEGKRDKEEGVVFPPQIAIPRVARRSDLHTRMNPLAHVYRSDAHKHKAKIPG